MPLALYMHAGTLGGKKGESEWPLRVGRVRVLGLVSATFKLM